MSYYYISNPYSGTKTQMEERAVAAATVCGKLLKKNIHAWSPIVHNHAMMKSFNNFSLEERRKLILDFDFSLLRASKGMIVLTLQGWKESFGVNAEIELCNELSIPIKYLDIDDLDNEFELEQVLRKPSKPHI